MNIYLCERDFAGFLTAVFYAYYNKETVDIISSDEGDVRLGDVCKAIQGNDILAKRVKTGITKRIGETGYEHIYMAYAAEEKGKENKIFRYLKLVFEYGAKCEGMYNEGAVSDFEDMYRRVVIETHRMKGFIRFQEMSNGTFYGYYASDHDIIEFLTPHFADRFNAQPFIIHDLKRRKAVAAQGGDVKFFDVSGDIIIELSEKEEIVSELWRQYQRNITIAGRKNLRLQRQFMPERYRWFANMP